MEQSTGKKFVIPKKSHDKIESVLKDLESDSDSENNTSSTDTKNGSRHSSSSYKHKHSERDRDSSKNHHSSKKAGDRYSHRDKYDSDHSSSKHKHGDGHKDETDKHRDNDKHRSESSSDRHRHSEYKDRDRRDKTDKSRNEHTGTSSEKHRVSDKERTKKLDESSSNIGHCDKSSSSAKAEKDRSSSHSSSSKSLSNSSSHSHKHSSSSKHSDHKSEKHKSSHSSHESDKHSSSKNQPSSKHLESSHSGGHSKSNYGDSQSKSDSNRKSDSHSKRDSHSKSSSSQKHSSNSDKSSKHSSSNKDKIKSKDLSLDELREQVQRMKAIEAKIVPTDVKSAIGEKAQTDKPSVPAKSRQGVELDAEKKKSQILSRTQMILERTKAKLAQAKENERQPKKRLGKRHTDDKAGGSSSDKVIKSKSVIKDEISSDSSDDELNVSYENPLMENLVKPEAGELLKDIKKKIDEKLGNYNFPDRPVKEKELKKKYLEKVKKLKEKGNAKLKDRNKDIKDRHKDPMKKMKDKREKIKEMMRSDYQNSFSEPKHTVKKPVIVRRHQNAPPPMNFDDLMKLAEQKCKETAPIPKLQPKKPEERPQTQDEIDRRRREKESRERKKLEAEGHSPASTSSTNNPVNNIAKVKKDQQTKPSSNPSVKQKDKYDSVNENVVNCKPSSKPAKPQQESTNPWDRIYGQIQKNNPKMDKRKRQAIESSDEEESDYDLDDDFIDDGDEGMDISSHIRNIFGYDKSRYKDEDDDVDNMEANFATVMKEEARSAKIGKMEDLEDMRREEEELKRKQLAKKKMKYR